LLRRICRLLEACVATGAATLLWITTIGRIPSGRRQSYSDLPKSVGKLVDDPFRSLAGELRRAGGYAKDTKPFSEFLWADFLRKRMKRKDVEADFDHAVKKALELARKRRCELFAGSVRSSTGGVRLESDRAPMVRLVLIAQVTHTADEG
jgi:hypothetical protein